MKYQKICIYYPPITKNGEYPLLGQNRQFKFSKSREIRIYPLVMSILATMLFDKKYEVLFLDGINLRYDHAKCEEILADFKPDIIIIETKAPLFKDHIDLIKNLKNKFNAKFIFCGDHVSFYPAETIENKEIDYVIVSGYYDFIVTELVDYLNGKNEKMPAGVFYKENNITKGNKNIKDYNLDDAPIINRELTRWEIYGEAYLYKPAAYILSGRGCGGSDTDAANFKSAKPGKCSFCIWQHSLWNRTGKLRSPAKFADEVEMLVKKYKVREIFDDNESGGTWSEKWLNDFYDELVKRNLIGKFYLSSNARADALSEKRVALLKKIGYRLLKIGLESANDATLDKIQKDEKFSQIETGIKNAKKAGLVVLMTTMVGYPWETEHDAERTYIATKKLMLYKTHFGDSLQSSIVVSYPGTPLYNYAKQNNLLTDDAKDLTKYDMGHTVLKTNIDTTSWCRKMWKIHLHPVFLFKCLFSLRRMEDIKVAFTGVISLLGHLRDYEKEK
ncbi:radical SAM protein [Candidatus Poribacteria bacterium]|nr:radical SAM protein [Candidatus Poribacteria bacterium]